METQTKLILGGIIIVGGILIYLYRNEIYNYLYETKDYVSKKGEINQIKNKSTDVNIVNKYADL
jgi:hypothetical protein